MTFRLHKSHRWRPVDWRYQKARECLRSGQRLSRVSDDAPTREIYFFLRQLHACRTREDEQKLMRESCVTWFAVEMHNDRETAAQGIVQARLLAGEAFESIGRKMNERGDVIERYAEYFFDVKSRLKCTDFIWSEVLGVTSHDGTERGKEDLLLRRLGYLAGVGAVDELMYGVSARAGSEMSTRRLEEYVAHTLTQKCLTAIEQMDPANPKAVAEMLKLYARFWEIRQSGRNETSRDIDYRKNVEVLMKQLSWSIGPNKIPKDLLPWSETAVELRADEQLRVAAGETLKNEAELRSLRLRDPEPTPIRPRHGS